MTDGRRCRPEYNHMIGRDPLEMYVLDGNKIIDDRKCIYDGRRTRTDGRRMSSLYLI